MAKRRKKASKKSERVTVSRAALEKVITLGAGHHKKLRQLKATVRAVPKKRAKKTARRRRS